MRRRSSLNTSKPILFPAFWRYDQIAKVLLYEDRNRAVMGWSRDRGVLSYLTRYQFLSVVCFFFFTVVLPGLASGNEFNEWASGTWEFLCFFVSPPGVGMNQIDVPFSVPQEDLGNVVPGCRACRYRIDHAAGHLSPPMNDGSSLYGKLSPCRCAGGRLASPHSGCDQAASPCRNHPR